MHEKHLSKDISHLNEC